MACQATCAMCCVEAPAWHGRYDYYTALTKLIEQTCPEILLVQGGEVLVQKKTLQWVAGLRESYPSMKIYLVTNGNANSDMLDTVENLFDRVYVSFVGFQPETYNKIMGLDFKKTIAFVENLIEQKKTEVFLKYLVTPLSLHEADLFLAWSLSLRAKRVMFEGAFVSSYIRLGTFDDYWRKIFERTSKDIKTTIIRNKKQLKADEVMIALDSEVVKLLGIDSVFINQNELNDNVTTRSQSRLFYPVVGVDFQIWPSGKKEA